METALNSYVLGKHTIVEVIENSNTISEWFADLVKQVPVADQIGGAISNLGMAKHRFSSLSKRLGRFVGKICAVFETAEKIRIVRNGKSEAQVANLFLKDFAVEQFIMLSMMADAADEAYMFTAYCDNGDMDLSLQADEVGIFEENAAFLLTSGRCVDEDIVGYTSFAIKEARKPRLLNYGKALAQRGNTGTDQPH